jgi:hypothetical protein
LSRGFLTTFYAFSKLIFSVRPTILHTILQKGVLSKIVKTARSEEFRGTTRALAQKHDELDRSTHKGMIAGIDDRCSISHVRVAVKGNLGAILESWEFSKKERLRRGDLSPRQKICSRGKRRKFRLRFWKVRPVLPVGRGFTPLRLAIHENPTRAGSIFRDLAPRNAWNKFSVGERAVRSLP